MPAMTEYDCSPYVFEPIPMDVRIKTVAAKVSPCVVAVSTFGIAEEVGHCHDKRELVEDKFECSGIIIDCEFVSDSKYSTTVLAPAILFKHDGLQPNNIKVRVYLLDIWYNGELLACDFHYNLAAIRFQSKFPLKAAELRGLDDVLPSGANQQLQLCEGKQFQLLPHSNLSRLRPGDTIITCHRPSRGRRLVMASSGVVCFGFSKNIDCNELYSIKHLNEFQNGGPVCNYHGEVIGIMFHNSSFLPMNIVLRWWNHYKSYREFCRPWLGMKVGNLYAARLDFRQQLLEAFPNFSAGVIVGKIAEDSPAYRHGIRPKDVIIKCDDKLVHSNLEFFEQIWDKAGKSMDFTLLRASDKSELNLRMIIGDTASDKFNQWHLPTPWQGGRSKRSKRRKLRSSAR